ncbi:hypothetical protein SAMN05444280_12849 [Tangfeifania diversioriginum]|uniref:Alpha/beta hydrolase family protein n=1 Tax=Tangfeifania diversioriginum TaxID=1168035 RepID=A0A1M6LVR8_9BACT|nr:hypothetical protein SAMN05444280_12849 [Tangfeifania diversioriginum]
MLMQNFIRKPALKTLNFSFRSEFSTTDVARENEFLSFDSAISENRYFHYSVIVPVNSINNSCIMLLHGLNEQSWDKYISWAEYLAASTRKPVILFPIAFHINRRPSAWSDPRKMTRLIEKRKRTEGDFSSLSFANVAMSERLTEEPLRFYNSGIQTVEDISRLASQISNGRHPLFGKGTTMDFFGYSIGSFLAEILLMANPGKLFSASRLFIFCGGAIFGNMYGESKYIMDRQAYNLLLRFYCENWIETGFNRQLSKRNTNDFLFQAFNSMIKPDINQNERETFFESQKHRISGISLLKDKVMPFSGVEACMGKQRAEECFEVMDFPFEYSHESPFPENGRIDRHDLKSAFNKVFKRGAEFLA